MNIGFLYNELPADLEQRDVHQFTGALSIDAHLDTVYHGISRYCSGVEIFLIDQRDLKTLYVKRDTNIVRFSPTMEGDLCVHRFDLLFISPYAVHSIDAALSIYSVAKTVLSLPAVWWYEHPDIYSYSLLELNIANFRRTNTCFIAPSERICDYLSRFATLFTGLDVSERIISIPYYVHSFKEREISEDETIIIDCGGPWRWTANHIFAEAFVQYCNEHPNTKIRFVFSLKDPGNPDHEAYQKQIIDTYAGLENKSNVVMLPWADKEGLRRYLSRARFGLSVNLDTIEGYLSSRVRLRDYMSYRLPVITTKENIFYQQHEDICVAVEPTKESFLELFGRIEPAGRLPRWAPGEFNDVAYDRRYAEDISVLMNRLELAPGGIAKSLKEDVKVSPNDLMRTLSTDEAGRLLQRVSRQMSREQMKAFLDATATDPMFSGCFSACGSQTYVGASTPDDHGQAVNTHDELADCHKSNETLCLFQIDGADSAMLTEGHRPYAKFSHTQNLYYLAHEARRIGCRVAFIKLGEQLVVEVDSVYPSVRIRSEMELSSIQANKLSVFGMYPWTRHVTDKISQTIPRQWTFVVPAIHWLEDAKQFQIDYVDQLREGLIYDIDNFIVQNAEMGELIYSLSTLLAGNIQRDRVLVAPCGFLPEDERSMLAYELERNAIRKEMDLDESDILIINSGGVWTWTDLDVFLNAFVEFHRELPGNKLKVVFMGLRQEDNEGHQELVDTFNEILDANTDLVESGAIRVYYDWTDASRRLPRYNWGADLGLNVSKASIETAQSYRQRFVEYVKAGLPVINTVGDPMSRSEFRDMMVLVEPGREETYLAAFHRLVAEPALLSRLRENARALRGRLRTDRNYGPALKKILEWSPVSVEARRENIMRYSTLPSFAETLGRRGDLRSEREDRSSLGPQKSGPTLDSILGLPNEQFVHLSYQLILRRPADGFGLKTYLRLLANGVRRSAVLYAIYNSKEARDLRGYRYILDETKDSSDDIFLEATYRNVLGRMPDDAGRKYYSAILMKTGRRAKILKSITNSEEARARQRDQLAEFDEFFRTSPDRWRFRLASIISVFFK